MQQTSVQPSRIDAATWTGVCEVVRNKAGRSRQYINDVTNRFLADFGGTAILQQTFIDSFDSGARPVEDVLPADIDPESSHQALSYIFRTLHPTTVADLNPETGHLVEAGADIPADCVEIAGRLLGKERSEEITPEYQTRLVAERMFVTGDADAPHRSTSSFLVQAAPDRPFIFYMIAAPEIIFLISHPRSGKLDGAYFAQRNILIGYDVRRHFGGPITGTMRALAVQNSIATRAYVDRGNDRRIGLVCGSMRHWGHTILNEYDGFQKFAEHDLLTKVDAIYVGRSQFMRYQMMYPDLAGKPEVRYSDMLSGYRNSLEENLLLVRATTGTYSMSRATSERMVSAARLQTNRRMAEPYEEASKCYPLVWFEIRTNDRVWEGQAQGIAAIANKLKERFPKVGIVVAGWSRMVDDPDDATDMAMIAADRAVLDEIRSYLRADIPLFDGVGMETSEKIIWCLIPDAFVAVFSSGILYPLGLGRISGVIHSNTGFHGRYARGTVYMIEDCPQFLPVPKTDITDLGMVKSYFDQNHTVEWSVICKLILKVLERAAKDRSDRLAQAAKLPDDAEPKKEDRGPENAG